MWVWGHGIYWGYIGIMENELETATIGLYKV